VFASRLLQPHRYDLDSRSLYDMSSVKMQLMEEARDTVDRILVPRHVVPTPPTTSSFAPPLQVPAIVPTPSLSEIACIPSAQRDNPITMNTDLTQVALVHRRSSPPPGFWANITESISDLRTTGHDIVRQNLNLPPGSYQLHVFVLVTAAGTMPHQWPAHRSLPLENSAREFLRLLPFFDYVISVGIAGIVVNPFGWAALLGVDDEADDHYFLFGTDGHPGNGGRPPVPSTSTTSLSTSTKPHLRNSCTLIFTQQQDTIPPIVILCSSFISTVRSRYHLLASLPTREARLADIKSFSQMPASPLDPPEIQLARALELQFQSRSDASEAIMTLGAERHRAPRELMSMAIVLN
jgi:hypothetical protein